MSDETRPPDDPPPPFEQEPESKPEQEADLEHRSQPEPEPEPESEPEPVREPSPEIKPEPLPQWAARERVTGPAVGLMVVAVVGAVLQLSAIPIKLIGLSLGPWAGPGGWWADFLGAMAWLLWISAGLAVAAVVFYAGVQMKNLRNWTLAAVAGVLVMVPCVSPCCLLGIPVGVWSLIVLSDSDVRDAFL